MQNGKKLILAVAAVLITVGALWLTSRSLAPKDATWEDVLAEARSGGYRLMTTEELRDRYQQEVAGLLLVDTRQEWEYRTGRIKGALNFSMEPTGWARWRDAGSLAGVSRAGQGASYRLLLSGRDMSPQRLGGPGGREARVQERLSRAQRIP